MAKWLLKSEPDVWSLDQQKKAGEKGVAWDGVRNYQAPMDLCEEVYSLEALSKLKTSATLKAYCLCSSRGVLS